METKQIVFIGLLMVFFCLLFPLLLTRRYNRAVGLYLLLFFLFFDKDINLFFTPYRGTSFGINIGVIDAVICALLLRHVLQLPMRDALFWLQVIFLAWSALGFAIAERPLFVLFEWVKYFKAAGFYLLSRALAQGIDRQKLIVTIRVIFLSVATLQVLMGFLQYRRGVYRLNGSFEHSNDLSIVLNLILPFLFLSLFEKHTRRKTIWIWFCFLGSCACVIMTRSRAGWATMFLGVTSMAFVLLWKNVGSTFKKRPEFQWLTVARVVGVLVVLSSLGVAKFLPNMIRRIQEAPKSSAESRDEHNHHALIMARENVLGVGLNNYVLATVKRFDKDIDGVNTTVAHHLYYLTAAETGFIGLVIFLLLPGLLLTRAFIALFQEGTTHSMALFIGSSTALLQSLFEPVMRHQKPMYLWLFCIVFAWRLLDVNEKRSVVSIDPLPPAPSPSMAELRMISDAALSAARSQTYTSPSLDVLKTYTSPSLDMLNVRKGASSEVSQAPESTQTQVHESAQAQVLDAFTTQALESVSTQSTESFQAQNTETPQHNDINDPTQKNPRPWG
ncbi:MAG: O-antigen ligase family protein [Myxococcota bacterium]